jgi:hypothetical protein
MARPPFRRQSNSDILRLTRQLLRNDRIVQSIAAARPTRLGKTITRLANRNRDRKAKDKFSGQRETGLSLNKLLSGVERNIRANSIRDKVTIVQLRIAKARDKILSKTLTYDKTKGRLQVRPHKHVVAKLPSEGETAATKFAKAKRIRVSCDCEDFMFRHEYALAKRWGAADIKFSNGEFPFDKNPNLNATICKHLYVLLRYIKQNNL